MECRKSSCQKCRIFYFVCIFCQSYLYSGIQPHLLFYQNPGCEIVIFVRQDLSYFKLSNFFYFLTLTWWGQHLSKKPFYFFEPLRFCCLLLRIVESTPIFSQLFFFQRVGIFLRHLVMSHFSVSQHKVLRSRVRNCLSKLRRIFCSKECHSFFCSLFISFVLLFSFHPKFPAAAAVFCG